MPNLTRPTEFLLLEFSQVYKLQILHFFLFLTIYIVSLTVNLFIVIVVLMNHRLHSPMYFFLMNLALANIGSISVIVPKSMTNSLMNNRLISYPECTAQVFFFLFFEASEYFLLTVMAHDRHVAICNPLQYETIMNKEACIQMIVIVWLVSLFYAVLHTSGTFSIKFCSNKVDQFFCEIPKLLKISCSDSYLFEVGLIVFCGIIIFGCFIFVVTTYVFIFTTVLKIPSVHGQKKAICTCLPHLSVFSLMLFTGLFVYIRPPSNTSSDLELIFVVIYAILPPVLNPFIYTMRNKEFQNALWNLYKPW
ncbi:olfactory receptor 14A16-like [Pseudonaja textilis]|uniref:olfactory receptor 14A16-like n=1 Tax=Pseudonaja textilis TaxID=8673 RepID=UPI000EA904E9|nr:olfactory receptor 14A16-like [Pseudonaja textilis]